MHFRSSEAGVIFGTACIFQRLHEITFLHAQGLCQQKRPAAIEAAHAIECCALVIGQGRARFGRAKERGAAIGGGLDCRREFRMFAQVLFEQGACAGADRGKRA